MREMFDSGATWGGVRERERERRRRSTVSRQGRIIMGVR